MRNLKKLTGGLYFKEIILAASVLLVAGCGDSPVNSASNATNNSTSTTTGGGAGAGTNATIRIGSGTGAGFTQGILAADSTSLQSGDTVNLSVNLVDENGNAVSDQFSVNFSSNCFGQGLSSFSNSSVSTTAGGGTTQYTALGCSGTDTVTASVSVGGNTITATVNLTIASDQVQSVEFVSIENPQIQLQGLGGTEQTDVVFRLVGALGAPIIGEEVTFSLSSTSGGIHFAGQGAPLTVTDVSDQTGTVSAKVQSGTTPASISVTATWTDSVSGLTVTGVSDDIIISTGFPVEKNLSVSYGPWNPAGAFETDGVAVTVNVIASDSLGNDVPDGTAISFVSPESGNIDNSCVLVSGECTVTWRSSGPRSDGRVTIMAFTDGVEDFIDTNGNNIYDAGVDGFIGSEHDEGEPFVDSDEDCGTGVFAYGCGEHGPLIDEASSTTNHEAAEGEFFVDVNDNGIWDKGDDGVRSDSVTIAQTVVIAMPSEVVDLSSICWTGTFGSVGGNLVVGPGQTVNFSGLGLCDSENPLNPLPIGTTVAFSVEAGATDYSIASSAATVTIENTIEPTFHGIAIKHGDASAGAATLSGTLKLTITTPTEPPVDFFWNIVGE